MTLRTGALGILTLFAALGVAQAADETGQEPAPVTAEEHRLDVSDAPLDDIPGGERFGRQRSSYYGLGFESRGIEPGPTGGDSAYGGQGKGR